MKKDLLFLTRNGRGPAQGLLPLAVILFWLFQSAAHTQTIWTGATSKDWATAPNWSAVPFLRRWVILFVLLCLSLAGQAQTPYASAGSR